MNKIYRSQNLKKKEALIGTAVINTHLNKKNASLSMAGPLGGLALQKWAASQARAAAAAAIAQAASSSSVFTEYGSDNEPKQAVALAAVAGYGSGSDSEPEQTETRATVAGYGSGGPAQGEGDGEDEGEGEGECSSSALAFVRVEGGGPARSAGPSDYPKELRSTHSDAANGSAAAKRRRLLPSSCTALVDARPAAEDRLAQQPKEPSREEKKAEFNAEQARRIEELFFWCERMHAREETFQTRMNLHVSRSLQPGVHSQRRMMQR
jgi:hypothetical protein